jgi:hypothetical protein
MDLTGLGSIFDFGSKLLDKVVPDPAQKAAAQLEMLKLAQNGELETLKTSLSAIVTEGSSNDPWTSRARPSFLYVVYVLILTAIPMGIVSAISPTVATAIIAGFHNWLAAIPDAFIQLFGVGYLGYVGGRSFDKWKGTK